MAAEKVSFPSAHADGDAQGVMVGDRNAKKGLIVLHEWWGLNDLVKQKGAKFAEEGNLLVLVADMYRGKVAIDREQAGHLAEGLDWLGALKDVSAGATFLKSLGCTGVGVTGFCMGGALAFAAAVVCPEVDAVAPFYGIPGPDIADLTAARIPIQAHFGEKDHLKGFSSPDDYEPLREKLIAAGVPIELNTYDAGHSFTSTDSPNYDEQSATLALGRMIRFMQDNL